MLAEESRPKSCVSITRPPVSSVTLTYGLLGAAGRAQSRAKVPNKSWARNRSTTSDPTAGASTALTVRVSAGSAGATLEGSFEGSVAAAAGIARTINKPNTAKLRIVSQPQRLERASPGLRIAAGSAPAIGNVIFADVYRRFSGTFASRCYWNVS